MTCARLGVQDEALAADQERLEAVESAVGQLKAHLESLVASRANRVRQQQQQLQKRLLRVMHIVEVRNYGKTFRSDHCAILHLRNAHALAVQ